MVTLVGPGGIGKTRLAMAVAARSREATRQPVYWAHLARLPRNADAGIVSRLLVSEVVDGDFSDRTERQILLDTLGRSDATGRAVLVLDNCEHVLDGVGAVSADLLAALPGLTILATSRTAIGWVDEHLVEVPPLSREHAVTLLRQRAELVGRPISERQAEPICRHLHYYPLHIRLAAARLRYQSPARIVRDLDGSDTDRRLHWSPGFRVGVDERHRSIDAVIAWSYALCGPQERLLFQRMSVFAPGHAIEPRDDPTDLGADLTAIETVCADADLVAEQVEGLLERLADRSLIALHIGAESVRYSLLESFRVFAGARLRESGAQHAREFAARHRRYYRDQVSTARANRVGPREQELLDGLGSAWDNIRWAVDRSLREPRDAVVGAAIAADLIAVGLPFLIGSLRESRGLAERSLAAAQTHCPTELRVSARAMIGMVTVCQGRSDLAEDMLAECVTACIDTVEGWREDPTVDLGLPPDVEYLWGSVLMLSSSDARATAVLARARVKYAAVGDAVGALMAELFEALSAAFHGTAEIALATTARHLDRVVAAGPQWSASWARFARAIALCRHGDPHEALALCDAAAAWQIPMRDRWGGVWGLHIRSWILAALIAGPGRGDHLRATRWAGEIAVAAGRTDALRRDLGLDLRNLGPWAERTDNAVAIARKVLGDNAFDPIEHRSRTAPSTPDTPTPPPNPTPAAWHELTRAEQAVAILAASGLTNTAIATSRGTSTRTVDAQVAAILSKLMINSRKQIRALLPPEALDRRAQVAESR
ncbi:LuxR family transcriptional regulator [Nocardia panacis]|uniref:LuxR family transcriptional regulator n=1 Tax=Nocardia panacis TaxID=2340916 RepID=A0A3A4KFP8_9NOCA|nr:LuxR C-terminal-related transcriptional regulator [Nocardia panacis]RJO74748.1 LuxR family transcriptional regulator [Nocardia panacis]